MRKYSLLILFASYVAAVCGFILRRFELATAFEPHSGLTRPDAPATWYLAGFTAFYLLVFALLAFTVYRRYKQPGNFEDAFGTYTIAYPLISSVIGVIWFFGTVMHMINLLNKHSMDVTEIYFLILSAMASVSIIFFSIEMFQDPRLKRPYVLSVVPIIFLCYWLIMLYRINAANPVLVSYIYLCFAVISSILVFYYTIGFLYGKPALGKSLLSYCACIYFCAVALADLPVIGIFMILCMLLLNASIHLLLLLRNMTCK